jgi:hypothetical protein
MAIQRGIVCVSIHDLQLISSAPGRHRDYNNPQLKAPKDIYYSNERTCDPGSRVWFDNGGVSTGYARGGYPNPGTSGLSAMQWAISQH